MSILRMWPIFTIVTTLNRKTLIAERMLEGIGRTIVSSFSQLPLDKNFINDKWRDFVTNYSSVITGSNLTCTGSGQFGMAFVLIENVRPSHDRHHLYDCLVCLWFSSRFWRGFLCVYGRVDTHIRWRSFDRILHDGRVFLGGSVDSGFTGWNVFDHRDRFFWR